MATTSSEPLYDMTGFQRDLLVAINRLDKPHGLAIKDYLSEWYGEVRHGRMYPNLDTLVDMGMVQKGAKDRRTNEYTLTRRGERELAAHVAWMQNGE